MSSSKDNPGVESTNRAAMRARVVGKVGARKTGLEKDPTPQPRKPSIYRSRFNDVDGARSTLRWRGCEWLGRTPVLLQFAGPRICWAASGNGHARPKILQSQALMCGYQWERHADRGREREGLTKRYDQSTASVGIEMTDSLEVWISYG